MRARRSLAKRSPITFKSASSVMSESILTHV
ncbi:MAG: hypothetical protein ACI9TH_004791 [Kiritimatiellia bacterium]